MKSHIFAEGSNTTAEDPDQPVKKYYQGLFSVVASLHDELAELTEAHLHVLSEEYGLANGVESMSSVYDDEQQPVGKDEMAKQARAELINTATDADVMVVLLSSETFQQTVEEVWNELVEDAKPESVWCLGAARSSLEALNLDELEAEGCTVLTYKRVGVARIGTETREDLLQAVDRKATK